LFPLQVYDEPTVIIAQRVTGEEEVPEGAVAVLTPDAPDVLSHVSVRARNMRVLFAICHDPGELAKVIAVPETRHLVESCRILRPCCSEVGNCKGVSQLHGTADGRRLAGVFRRAICITTVHLRSDCTG